MHDVFLALDPELAGFAGFCERAERDQIVEMHRLRGDKAALEIGVDHAGGRGRLVARVNRPGARFFFAGGEVSAQPEQMIDGADQRADAAALDAEVAQIFRCFRLAQIDQLALDLRADHDRFGGEMFLGVFLAPRAHAARRRSPHASCAMRREIALRRRCRRKASALK